MDSFPLRYWMTSAFFLVGFCLNAQQEFKGKVVDAESGLPIPYVNVGIVGNGVGTVSNEEGLFHFYSNETNYGPLRKVLFSALGYANLNLPVDKVALTTSKFPVFKMEPAPVVLDEVVVVTKKKMFIPDAIGYQNFGEQSFAYWKDAIALGGELATKMNVQGGLRKLEQFKFEVVDNASDSVLLRVNVYDDDGPSGSPKTNLNQSGKNILVALKKSDKEVVVDLKPFHIYVQNDFMLSLELLKLYGNEEPGLILLATPDKHGSYRRYASQDKWECFTDQNIAFYVETRLEASDAMIRRFERKQNRQKNKGRTISGFTIRRGKMVSGVRVTNKRTKETVFTDEKGRYAIAAKRKDKVFFQKEGYVEMVLTVGDKPIINVIMKDEVN